MFEDALKLKNVEARGAEAGVGRETKGKALPVARARNDSTGAEKSPSRTSPLPAEAPARRLQVDARVAKFVTAGGSP